MARPAVQRGMKLRVEEASKVDMKDPKVQALLFKQRARASADRSAQLLMMRWAARDDRGPPFS